MNDTNDMVASEQATQILTKKEHGDRMAGWLDKLAPTIERALSKAMDTPAFVTTCLTAFKTTPKLMDCHPTSFLAVVMQCAQLKLPPDPTLGWAWIIPRR